ncbi:MAG: hypothetical protein NZ990_05755 [Myxococcota bacterium]|nr:hypothetical protein [Myxococcota bacterium]
MPRDLSDVLHYFGPELAAPKGSRGRFAAPEPKRRAAPTALQIVGVPIGDRDVVRAALTWNLAVEAARLGARALVLTPENAHSSPLWPHSGSGPLGVELRSTLARDLENLGVEARAIASEKGRGPAEGGLVFVGIPPDWLESAAGESPLLRWSLLFSSSRTSDLKDTLRTARTILERQPEGRVGVTIHGAQCRSEAENAFMRLARAARRSLPRDLSSYGLLVDDLHVYRAIVAQRPIGLSHPQSPAARALRDVAELLLGDTGEKRLG